MTLLSVPIIDIGPYWTGGDAKRAVAAVIDRSSLSGAITMKSRPQNVAKGSSKTYENFQNAPH